MAVRFCLFVGGYFLLLCGLFYEEICFMSYLVLFCSCVISPFSIAITSLGEERTNLSVFHAFIRFELVWFCLFFIPHGVWEELVIVASLDISLTFFFICGVCFVIFLFLIFPFCDSERLFLVTVALPGYFYLYFVQNGLSDPKERTVHSGMLLLGRNEFFS